MKALLVPVGLVVFLVGVRIMGRNLRHLSGLRAHHLLPTATSTPLRAALTGALVTSILQSSSATSAMTVGLVHGRLMPLPAAVGVVMGANVGTTVTAQFMALGLDAYGLVLIGLGLVLWARQGRLGLRWGGGLLGVGLLLVGLNLMKSGAASWADLEGLKTWALWIRDHPLGGMAVGFGLTCLIQSSSAAIGMLQTLAGQGILPVASVLPMMYGENVGTTMTAILASVGLSRSARRVAVCHLLFNLTGSLIFLLVTPYVAGVVSWISGDAARQVAHAHTLFNLLNLALQLPMLGILVVVSGRLVAPEEGSRALRPKYVSVCRQVRSACLRREIKIMIRLIARMIGDASRGGAKETSGTRSNLILRKESFDRLWARSRLRLISRCQKASPGSCIDGEQETWIALGELLREAAEMCLDLKRQYATMAPGERLRPLSEDCLNLLHQADRILSGRASYDTRHRRVSAGAGRLSYHPGFAAGRLRCTLVDLVHLAQEVEARY